MLSAENTLYIINLNQYRRPVETQLELRPKQRSNITSLDSIFDNFPDLDQLYVTKSLDMLRPLQSRAQRLRKIDLHGNYIEYISRSVFSAAHALEYINLNLNRISFIEDEAFGGLVHLHALHIEDNALTSITNATFAGIHNLRHLNLRKNHLATLAVGVFTLNNLVELILAENRLVMIANDTFKLMSNLRKVSLAHNAIKYIDLSLLLQDTIVERLDLEDNQIGQRQRFVIRCTENMNFTLKHLILARNNLTTSHILNGLICLRQLETLNLNGNNLTRIDDIGNMNYHYPKLRVLYIIGNRLDCDWMENVEFDTSLVFTQPRLKDVTYRGITCYRKN